MPKRSKTQQTKRDWRWYASFILNGAVALSMVVGTVLLFAPPPRPSALPTLEVPTAAPTSPIINPVPNVAPTIAPPSPTPKASATNYDFAVTGDSRDGDAVYLRVLDRVMKDGSEFLIHTGDLVASDSQENWTNFQNLMKGFTLPFFPMPGNHELRGAGKISDYVQYSGAPTPSANSSALTTHYSFDRGAVHFTMVDSSVGSLLDSEFAWMDNDLAASNAPIKMLFVHHPPFDPAGTSHVMVMGGDRFVQIAKQRGVKYVFAGHIHCYEEELRDGVDYIITGGAGAPLDCAPNAGGYYHYMHVTVRGDKITTRVVKIEE